MGFGLGFLSSLFGFKAFCHTINIVETFVEKHYGEQVRYLEKNRKCMGLLSVLKKCCEEEIAHKEEAAERISNSRQPRLLFIWQFIVESFSNIANNSKDLISKYYDEICVKNSKVHSWIWHDYERILSQINPDNILRLPATFIASLQTAKACQSARKTTKRPKSPPATTRTPRPKPTSRGGVVGRHLGPRPSIFLPPVFVGFCFCVLPVFFAVLLSRYPRR